jgi:6-pyruvoyl-tetrahydropterin synthase
MALIATTRRFSFRGVHSLLSGTHKEKVHGHEYFLEISFHSCPRRHIEREVQTRILSQLDGRDLTSSVTPATGEVLVEWIDRQLRESPVGPCVVGVALQETRKNRFVSALSDVRVV